MNRIPEEIIKKWLDGTADESERASVVSWASESPDNQKELLALKMVYMSTLTNEYQSAAQKKRRRLRRVLAWSLSSAAAVASVVSALFILVPEKDDYQSLSAVNISVPVGQMSKLVLSDSTCVWLNSNSELEVLDSETGERAVALKGEAYFEVTKDSKHPFVVSCGDRLVKVLGTSFNLSSYSEELFAIKLFSGSVELLDKRAGFSCRMNPDEQIEYSDGKYIKTTGTNRNSSEWRSGKYSFADASLDSIMEKVGDYYGVKIMFQDNRMKQLRCTCSFHSGDTLENILELICKAYKHKIKYSLSEDKSQVNIHY